MKIRIYITLRSDFDGTKDTWIVTNYAPYNIGYGEDARHYTVDVDIPDRYPNLKDYEMKEYKS